MCTTPLPFCWEGRGVERLTKFSKRRLEGGVTVGVTVDLFKGVAVFTFYIKNKLKSGMFNDKKKFINKNVSLCHK